MKIRLPRPVALGVATLVAVGAGVIGASSAQAAQVGPLSFTPSSGTDTSSMSVDTSAACPSGTNALITIQGAGFPTAPPPQNVVGNTPLTTFPTNAAGGYSVQFTNTLAAFAAQQNPPATLSGTYTFTFICRTALSGTDLGDFTGQIAFSDPHTWAAVGGTTKVATTTTVTATPPSAAPNTPVALKATVAPSTGTGTPGGTVQFMDGTTALGAPVTLAGGTGTLTTSTLAAGAHSITAVYSGNSGFLTSRSAPVTVTVTTLPASTTTLSVNPAGPVNAGTAVTLTSTVTPAGATGTVQFQSDGAALGAPVALAGGTATLTTSTLPSGTHQLTAVYSGSATLAGSSSPAVTLVVNPGAGGGTTATETITVKVPTGTLTLTVANAAVSLPDLQLSADNTHFATTGPINPATVTDTRAGNPGWTVSGVVTDFSQIPGTGKINGSNLGWTPSVVDQAATQTVTPGPVVQPAQWIDPGVTPTDPALGLKTPRTMATATPGHGIGTAHITAALALNAPTSTPAGTYTATLTLTAI